MSAVDIGLSCQVHTPLYTDWMLSTNQIFLWLEGIVNLFYLYLINHLETILIAVWLIDRIIYHLPSFCKLCFVAENSSQFSFTLFGSTYVFFEYIIDKKNGAGGASIVVFFIEQ